MGAPPSRAEVQESKRRKKVEMIESAAVSEQRQGRREREETWDDDDRSRRVDPVVASDGFEILDRDRDCLLGGGERDGSDVGGEACLDGASHGGKFGGEREEGDGSHGEKESRGGESGQRVRERSPRASGHKI